MIGLFFNKPRFGSACMEEKFLPCKLIGDAAYPVQPWMYCPFKGNCDGLESCEAKPPTLKRPLPG